MRRIVNLLFASALLSVPATLVAQRPDAAHPGIHGMDPVAHILAQRAELNLSADQVTRLETIQSRLETQNRPLLEQLQAARAEFHADHPDHARELTPEQREEMRQRMQERHGEAHERARDLTPEQREEMRERMHERMHEHRGEAGERLEQLRPLMEQLRENNRQAMTEARAVLSAEQQTRLRDAHAQRHGGQHDGRSHRQHR